MTQSCQDDADDAGPLEHGAYMRGGVDPGSNPGGDASSLRNSDPMRCEFGVFENRQSDNAGDNKTPSYEDDADAREAISNFDSAQASLRFEAMLQVFPRATSCPAADSSPEA